MNYTVRWTELKSQRPNDIIIIHDDESDKDFVLNEDAEWFRDNEMGLSVCECRYVENRIKGNNQSQANLLHDLKTVVETLRQIGKSVTVMEIYEGLTILHKIEPK